MSASLSDVIKDCFDKYSKEFTGTLESRNLRNQRIKELFQRVRGERPGGSPLADALRLRFLDTLLQGENPSFLYSQKDFENHSTLGQPGTLRPVPENLPTLGQPGILSPVPENFPTLRQHDIPSPAPKYLSALGQHDILSPTPKHLSPLGEPDILSPVPRSLSTLGQHGSPSSDSASRRYARETTAIPARSQIPKTEGVDESSVVNFVPQPPKLDAPSEALAKAPSNARSSKTPAGIAGEIRGMSPQSANNKSLPPFTSMSSDAAKMDWITTRYLEATQAKMPFFDYILKYSPSWTLDALQNLSKTFSLLQSGSTTMSPQSANNKSLSDFTSMSSDAAKIDWITTRYTEAAQAKIPFFDYILEHNPSWTLDALQNLLKMTSLLQSGSTTLKFSISDACIKTLTSLLSSAPGRKEFYNLWQCLDEQDTEKWEILKWSTFVPQVLNAEWPQDELPNQSRMCIAVFRRMQRLGATISELWRLYIKDDHCPMSIWKEIINLGLSSNVDSDRLIAKVTRMIYISWQGGQKTTRIFSEHPDAEIEQDIFLKLLDICKFSEKTITRNVLKNEMTELTDGESTLICDFLQDYFERHKCDLKICHNNGDDLTSYYYTKLFAMFSVIPAGKSEIDSCSGVKENPTHETRDAKSIGGKSIAPQAGIAVMFFKYNSKFTISASVFLNILEKCENCTQMLELFNILSDSFAPILKARELRPFLIAAILMDMKQEVKELLNLSFAQQTQAIAAAIPSQPALPAPIDLFPLKNNHQYNFKTLKKIIESMKKDVQQQPAMSGSSDYEESIILNYLQRIPNDIEPTEENYRWVDSLIKNKQWNLVKALFDKKNALATEDGLIMLIEQGQSSLIPRRGIKLPYSPDFLSRSGQSATIQWLIANRVDDEFSINIARNFNGTVTPQVGQNLLEYMMPLNLSRTAAVWCGSLQQKGINLPEDTTKFIFTVLDNNYNPTAQDLEYYLSICIDIFNQRTYIDKLSARIREAMQKASQQDAAKVWNDWLSEQLNKLSYKSEDWRQVKQILQQFGVTVQPPPQYEWKWAVISGYTEDQLLAILRKPGVAINQGDPAPDAILAKLAQNPTTYQRLWELSQKTDDTWEKMPQVLPLALWLFLFEKIDKPVRIYRDKNKQFQRISSSFTALQTKLLMHTNIANLAKLFAFENFMNAAKLIDLCQYLPSNIKLPSGRTSQETSTPLSLWSAIYQQMTTEEFTSLTILPNQLTQEPTLPAQVAQDLMDEKKFCALIPHIKKIIKNWSTIKADGRTLLGIASKNNNCLAALLNAEYAPGQEDKKRASTNGACFFDVIKDNNNLINFLNRFDIDHIEGFKRADLISLLDNANNSALPPLAERQKNLDSQTSTSFMQQLSQRVGIPVFLLQAINCWNSPYRDRIFDGAIPKQFQKMTIAWLKILGWQYQPPLKINKQHMTRYAEPPPDVPNIEAAVQQAEKWLRNYIIMFESWRDSRFAPPKECLNVENIDKISLYSRYHTKKTKALLRTESVEDIFGKCQRVQDFFNKIGGLTKHYLQRVFLLALKQIWKQEELLRESAEGVQKMSKEDCAREPKAAALQEQATQFYTIVIDFFCQITDDYSRCEDGFVCSTRDLYLTTRRTEKKNTLQAPSTKSDNTVLQLTDYITEELYPCREGISQAAITKAINTMFPNEIAKGGVNVHTINMYQRDMIGIFGLDPQIVSKLDLGYKSNQDAYRMIEAEFVRCYNPETIFDWIKNLAKSNSKFHQLLSTWIYDKIVFKSEDQEILDDFVKRVLAARYLATMYTDEKQKECELMQKEWQALLITPMPPWVWAPIDEIIVSGTKVTTLTPFLQQHIRKTLISNKLAECDDLTFIPLPNPFFDEKGKITDDVLWALLDESQVISGVWNNPFDTPLNLDLKTKLGKEYSITAATAASSSSVKSASPMRSG